MTTGVGNWTQPGKHRFLTPITYGPASATFTMTAGRVYLAEFQIPQATTVDRIGWYNFATVAGNVTVGIYGPLATEDTPQGAPLAVSVEVAMNGASAAQVATITTTTLQAGRYYVALEVSDVTATIGRVNATQPFTPTNFYYDRGGGYGALTDPCPASGVTGTAVQVMLRAVV